MTSVPGSIHTRVLTVGPLAFTAREAGEGPLVLMIHGFPDEPVTFDAQLVALARAGYHVVAPTLRGYEASSRPADASYRLVDLASDVTGWMDALETKSAHLVGHDWGATIACAAAVAAPARVRSLVMIAVPRLRDLFKAIRRDPRQMWRSRYMFLFQFGAVSDWWMRRHRGAAMLRLWRRWSPGWLPSPERMDSLRHRFSDPAIAHAALTYYRQVLDKKTDKGRASTSLISGTVQAPVLALCGQNDGCVSAEIFEAAMSPDAFPCGVVRYTVADAGHFPHAERSEVVNDQLLNWLARQS